jgi:hypothetical protein
MANEVIKSTAKEMTAALTESRDRWLAAVDGGDPMEIALAEADAKLSLLEQVKQANIYQLLARFCVPGTGMTEMVGNVSEHEAVRCTGLAILSGFVPGREEYAIFAQRGAAAKVYVKENGYRKLLGMLPHCVMGDVKVGYPQIQQLDGKVEVWAVAGEADCTVSGKRVSVEAKGEFAVRLPVKRSRESKEVIDNVDGIAAKARRRLLQMLWRKVSGSAFVDDANEADALNPDPNNVIVVESAPQPALPTQQETAAVSWGEEATQLGRKVNEVSQRFLDDFYMMLGECANMDELRTLYTQMQTSAKAQTDGKIDQRVMEFLTRFKDHRKTELGAQQP